MSFTNCNFSSSFIDISSVSSSRVYQADSNKLSRRKKIKLIPRVNGLRSKHARNKKILKVGTRYCLNLDAMVIYSTKRDELYEELRAIKFH